MNNILKKFLNKVTILGISSAILFSGAAAFTSTPAQAMSSAKADRVISKGKQYLGTPYKFGAKYGQTRTFDCSSFTKTVFSKFGVKLARGSKDQAKQGRYVSRSNLKKGDLVFFSTPRKSSISHVGIYVGNGKILHTFGSGGVKVSSMKSGWWDNHYITARRVM
jgi:cell wall-associated NlpC family hydrolase